MVKQIIGAKSAPASESSYRRLAPAMRIVAILGGFAVAATLSTSAAAQSPCTSTLPTIFLGRTPIPAAALVPFASGGSINSLVSAINTANTAFLSQSTAFIGAPPNPEPDQLGGGVWARGIGGQSDFKSTSTSTYALNGSPLSGNISCNTKTQLNFSGVQIGTDVAQLNWDGWNLHGGSTLGYLGANANDFASGGSFNDTLQVPFVGLYGAATKGGFFVDGQVRWNYYQNKIADTSNGLFGQNLDARGFSANGNIGYNYGFSGNWFIEPSAGFLWSKVSVDPLNTSGTFALANIPGLAPPATVDINPIYSALGRVSLRMGTSISTSDWILQPFATISGFREFRGNNSATLASQFGQVGVGGFLGGNLSATNIGNYGQFGLGLVAILPNTGWLAYVRTDYRTGEKINGWAMNGGLRYQLNPDHPVVTGRSADVPGAPLPVAAYNWTGFYLGPSLGVDWGYTNWTFLVNGNKTYPRFAGVLPGGQVGYNYQYGKWVFGVEGDAGWTNAHGARACPNGFFFNCEINVNSLYTVTGRIGYVWPDRVLWYAKGGLAIGEVRAQARCNTDSQQVIPFLGGGLLNPGCPAQGTTRTDAGWTVGGGSELALTNNWSVKAETSYFNLGTGHYTQGPNFDPSGRGVDVRRSGWISTIGLNYRFTGFGEAPAVVAKY
ncbi:MAG: autotransporter domain-containing protein [Pseudomonadota bacterium]|nr:autotransporter domain-containing protein [Pseudomonadota bacterium]